jgi:hypothetical protein
MNRRNVDNAIKPLTIFDILRTLMIPIIDTKREKRIIKRCGLIVILM